MQKVLKQVANAIALSVLTLFMIFTIEPSLALAQCVPNQTNYLSQQFDSCYLEPAIPGGAGVFVKLQCKDDGDDRVRGLTWDSAGNSNDCERIIGTYRCQKGDPAVAFDCYTYRSSQNVQVTPDFPPDGSICLLYGGSPEVFDQPACQ